MGDVKKISSFFLIFPRKFEVCIFLNLFKKENAKFCIYLQENYSENNEQSFWMPLKHVDLRYFLSKSQIVNLLFCLLKPSRFKIRDRNK